MYSYARHAAVDSCPTEPVPPCELPQSRAPELGGGISAAVLVVILVVVAVVVIGIVVRSRGLTTIRVAPAPAR